MEHGYNRGYWWLLCSIEMEINLASAIEAGAAAVYPPLKALGNDSGVQLLSRNCTSLTMVLLSSILHASSRAFLYRQGLTCPIHHWPSCFPGHAFCKEILTDARRTLLPQFTPLHAIAPKVFKGRHKGPLLRQTGLFGSENSRAASWQLLHYDCTLVSPSICE